MNIHTHIVISLPEYNRLKSCQEELKTLRQKYDLLKHESVSCLKGGGAQDLNLTLPFEVPPEESPPSDPPPVLITESATSENESAENEGSTTSNSKEEKKLEDEEPKEPWYYLGPPSP